MVLSHFQVLSCVLYNANELDSLFLHSTSSSTCIIIKDFKQMHKDVGMAMPKNIHSGILDSENELHLLALRFVYLV